MVVEYIDYENCCDCTLCFEVCPMDVFRLLNNRMAYIAYQSDCMCCYLCELTCPEDAVFVNPQRGQPIPLPY